MKIPDQLIAGHLDDALSDSEQAELNAWLKAEPANIQHFTEAVMFEQQIRAAVQANAQQQAATEFEGGVAPATSPSRWLTWRPLTAAAVGVVFGLFGASVVFAYAVPRMKSDKPRVVPLFNDGFEDAKAVSGRGFPSRAGWWSGDLAVVAPAEADVNPKAGEHMARLEPSVSRKFCMAARIVDLAEYPAPVGAESRTVEVTASFHRIPSDSAERNQIRLAVFAEAPDDVKPIWNSDHMFDQVLQHVARTVTTKPGEHGWQTLKATMEIPPGARSLVIYLGAAVPDDTAPKTAHFLDDVRAQFVIKKATP